MRTTAHESAAGAAGPPSNTVMERLNIKQGTGLMTSDFVGLIERAERVMERLEQIVPKPLSAPDWSQAVAWRYRKRASGLGAQNPMPPVAELKLSAVKETDDPKDKKVRNTRQFVEGRPANNVLLTGARGTGKSSLIRACLNAFQRQGLRLIEVDKVDMNDLPDIVELVVDRPEKFIVYCDDLSFEEGEPGYKALKSALDGSIGASSSNLLVYATSNRRHLLPETMKENLTYQHTEDGELHPGDVVEEKISLSERFGLWASFYPFNQDEYLVITAQWLKALGASPAEIKAARPQALLWALERGSRSGRVAHQFALEFMGSRGA
jgi:predicted AAA+ superfamily ATPase